MAPRIGWITIGHRDYQNDVGLEFAELAIQGLRTRGVLVVSDGQAYTDPLTAAARGLDMAGERLDGVIVWLGTWIECSTAVAAIREFEHLPFAIWGFPMFDRDGCRQSTGSFVAASALKGTLDRMGYRHVPFFGMPDDPAALDAATAFARAAHAVQRLKRTRLGLVGYASMAIYPGTFDHALLRRYVGPEVVQFDTYTLVNLAERAGHTEVLTVADDLRAKARVEVTDDRLLKAARLLVGLRELVDNHRLGAINVKCQYELSQEWGMTPCVALSWLADNGVIAGCEGDVMTTVTQCLLAYLSESAVAYGDILDLQGDQMLLSSCGFAPASMAHEGDEVIICELGHPGFDGIICSSTLRRGPVTFARLAEGRGDYRLVYGTGTGVETQRRQGRFPALQVKLDGDPQRLLENIPSQHWALCYGDVTVGLEGVCRYLGFDAVRV